MRRFRLRHLPFAIAALCAMPLSWAQVASGALPTGWNVRGGSAAISQNGNTLNIQQNSQQALVNFQTFNVGSGALVDIRQPNAQSALLARTVGGDPSQIQGQIKANGALWLINPAGIMVGAGARIDVGSFVASTLNVSDSDFLAGRLTFKSGATAAGEVRNAGTINAASGGSIYLVAPSVVNTGLVNAPNGEVLLAAGQNVQLMDTGTPGVAVAITGTPGEAKNIGRIVAEAGRIGLAAGLVSNSGEIRADSAVREGGRVFLRASGDLKTTAGSDISASGSSGGRVELIADGAAAIDGRVAATGSAGPGGYVDTSGHRSLDVVNVPVVGRGGEWHIDPYDIEIVASGPNTGVVGGNAIVSNESGARIGAGTIASQLDAGVDVSITTGTGNPTDPWHGDITVSAAIAKTGIPDSTLTLNASNNIVINAPITSTNGALNLALNSNYQGGYPADSHAVQLNANLDLHGGLLNVSEGVGGSGNGTLDIGGGTTFLNMPASAINAGTVNILPGGTLALNRGGSAISGALNNDGMVVVGGIGNTVLLDHGGMHGGSFVVDSAAGLSMSGGHSFLAGAGFSGGGTIEWSDDIRLASSMLFGPGGNRLVMHDINLWGFEGGSLSTQGAGTVLVDGQVMLRGAGTWINGANVVVAGNGAISAGDEGTRLQNDGTITTTGTQSSVLHGAGGALANFVNNGSLIKASATEQDYTGFASSAGSVVRADTGSLRLMGVQLDGQVQVAAGAQVTLDSVALNSNATFAGAGSMRWQNYITLMGDVDVGAAAPELSLGTSTAINGQGNVLTTHNTVRADGAQVVLLDQSTWNNDGTLIVGSGSAAALMLQGSGSFNNRAGGTVRIDAGATLDASFDEAHMNNGAIVLQGGLLHTNGADLYNNGSLGGSGTLDLGGATGGTLFNRGTVAPGTESAVGTLAVQGHYTQDSSGTLDIKLGAMGAGEFDLLDVDGAARLGGTLRIHALGGFAPANAAQADVVVARGGSSGIFDAVQAPPVSSAGGVATLSVGYPAPGSAAAARLTASVVPSLDACVANPSAAGCAGVLPTLAACTSTPSMAGCTAVLPTQAACSVSPSLAGCSVWRQEPPSADICTIAPNSALCQVLAPPTAGEPTKPVQQASNEVIKTVTAMPGKVLDDPAPAFVSADDKKKSDDKSDSKAVASSDKSGVKNDEPAKKMYCN